VALWAINDDEAVLLSATYKSRNREGAVTNRLKMSVATIVPQL